MSWKQKSDHSWDKPIEDETSFSCLLLELYSLLVRSSLSPTRSSHIVDSFNACFHSTSDASQSVNSPGRVTWQANTMGIEEKEVIDQEFLRLFPTEQAKLNLSYMPYHREGSESARNQFEEIWTKGVDRRRERRFPRDLPRDEIECVGWDVSLLAILGRIQTKDCLPPCL